MLMKELNCLNEKKNKYLFKEILSTFVKIQVKKL